MGRLSALRWEPDVVAVMRAEKDAGCRAHGCRKLAVEFQVWDLAWAFAHFGPNGESHVFRLDPDEVVLDPRHYEEMLVAKLREIHDRLGLGVPAEVIHGQWVGEGYVA